MFRWPLVASESSATTITDVALVALVAMSDEDETLGRPVTDRDTTLDRRSFLKRSAVAPLGIGVGVAERSRRQSARINRRIAFRRPETLSPDYTRRILLLTDRTNENPDVSDVAECAFGNWPTENMTIWEGIVVDAKNPDEIVGLFGQTPTIRAQKLVERKRIFVDERRTPVELGTPFIISRVVNCPGDWLGVEAAQLPGINIKTESGVSTQG